MYVENNRYKEDLEAAMTSVPGFEQFYGKSFLITGATGLIASFIIDLLLYANDTTEAGIRIFALGRDRDKLSERYASYHGREELQFVVQDVCEPLDMGQRVDYIIHAAGNGYPASFRENPVGTMTPALFGTFYLLEYARRYNITRFLYISSGEVYGQAAEGITAFKEDYSGYVDCMSTRSCYPTAKRAAETLCSSYYSQYGVDAVVARPCHTYGPNTTTKDNRANVQFINNVLRGEDIVLKSAGRQTRSYTYIADSASGILTVLLKGETGEAYNIANSKARVTIAEYAAIVARVGHCNCVFENPDELEKAEFSPITYAVLDSAKLESLGWSGRYSVEEGIRHTIEILKTVQRL